MRERWSRARIDRRLSGDAACRATPAAAGDFGPAPLANAGGLAYRRRMSPAREEPTRCPWSLGSDAYRAYHDREWGVPLHDERRLFEMLVLEGAQAGLSWSTILHKRDHYRAAFDHFDPEKVARYGATRVKRLLADAGIVRNRGKIAAAIAN